MKKIIISILSKVPVIRNWALTRANKRIRFTLLQLIWYIKKNEIYWPVHPNSQIVAVRNILIGVGDSPGSRVGGCYIQGVNGIIFGGYNFIGPGVGIISANHHPDNLLKPIVDKPVLIGAYCWIGMGAIILPSIQIGDHVIIAANSVVTKNVESFSIVAGNPAKVINRIKPESIIKFKDEIEYYGYIRKDSKKGKIISKRRIELLREYSEKHGSIISESLRIESLN